MEWMVLLLLIFILLVVESKLANKFGINKEQRRKRILRSSTLRAFKLSLCNLKSVTTYLATSV